MTPPAAIQGDYVNLRFVTSRNVCQIVIEIPIEAGDDFIKKFGTPKPASGVPVALARLGAGKAGEVAADASPAEPVKPRGGKLAQRAGILCGDGRFRTFLAERDPELSKDFRMLDTEMAADEVRDFCQVQSRAELDSNPEAARRFADLETSFKAWLFAA